LPATECELLKTSVNYEMRFRGRQMSQPELLAVLLGTFQRRTYGFILLIVFTQWTKRGVCFYSSACTSNKM